MLHAIIDIGSNTVRMAIYCVEGRSFDLLMKRKHTVGLAAYLKKGRLVRDGIEKTVRILRGFRSYIETFDIRSVHAFATAALRTATNSRAVCEEIARRTGVRIRVISGDEEAAYDFIGAVQSIPYPDGIMMDIGGGSTEIISYADCRMEARRSLPIGSLALRREHVARGMRRDGGGCAHRSCGLPRCMCPACPAYAGVGRRSQQCEPHV